VWATYEFLSGVISYCTKNANEIISMHKEADADVSKQKQFTLNWQLDTTQYTWIGFKGFEAKHKLSTISGLERLYYDRNAPYEKQVKFYNTYSPVTTITAPSFYIIPQAYSDIIHLYEMNGVKMKRLTKDTLLYVEAYHIDDYKTGKTPYESHYLHSGVKVTASQQMIIFHKGDYVVEMNQPVNRYIVETLEPEGGDSFFAWNYFDGILQQKEWFSDYIFEEKADSLLQADPKLKADLVARQKSDTAFAKDNWAQLSFIYQHSPYMEKTYNRYPVARIMQPVKLPCE
jgi:hypothetical protein